MGSCGEGERVTGASGLGEGGPPRDTACQATRAAPTRPQRGCSAEGGGLWSPSVPVGETRTRRLHKPPRSWRLLRKEQNGLSKGIFKARSQASLQRAKRERVGLGGRRLGGWWASGHTLSPPPPRGATCRPWQGCRPATTGQAPCAPGRWVIKLNVYGSENMHLVPGLLGARRPGFRPHRSLVAPLSEPRPLGGDPRVKACAQKSWPGPETAAVGHRWPKAGSLEGEDCQINPEMKPQRKSWTRSEI